jgi:hypothetical protein
MRSPDLPWLRPPSFITAANFSNMSKDIDVQGEVQRMTEGSIGKGDSFIPAGSAAYSSDLSLWEKKVSKEIL